MILITDSHVSEDKGNVVSFFDMLTVLEKENEDIVFLGDIFDLWVGFPRYENELHKKFLDWCRRAASTRTVGIVEGNHEFFVADRHPEAFTWGAATTRIDNNGCLLLHGDTIDSMDLGFRAFRAVTKSPIMKACIAVMPGGPRFTGWLKKRLEKEGSSSRKHLPVDIIKAYAELRFRRGIRTILAGHFHQDYYCYRSGNAAMHILPDWERTGSFARYDPESSEVTIQHWKEQSRT